MSHIFVSYSREDAEFMRRLGEDLTAAGFVVWVDEGRLEVGTPSWELAIERAIEKADAVVVVLSPDTRESLWVTRELNHAEKHHRRIFPMLVRGDATTSVPLRLASHQYIDARRDYAAAVRTLVASLKGHISPRPEKKDKRKALWLWGAAAIVAGLCLLGAAALAAPAIIRILTPPTPYVPVGYCGDGDCDFDEDCDGCPRDCECPQETYCGDGECDVGEDCDDCPQDCGECAEEVYCGDGTCNAGEDCDNCPQDCGECTAEAYCGDGTCDPGEGCGNCPPDCGECPPEAYCGDGTCDPGEGCDNCPQDCGGCPGKTPGDIVGMGIAGSNDWVYVWYSDGTVSAGSSTDLDVHRDPEPYSLPPDKNPGDIVGMGIAGSNDWVYVWYDDGTVSAGSSTDLDAHRDPDHYDLPPDKSLGDIVGMAIAGSDDHVYVWYSDRTVSSGTSTDLGFYRDPYDYDPPSGKSPTSIVGVGITGSDDRVYVWYGDGTTSAGSSWDLDDYRDPRSYTLPP